MMRTDDRIARRNAIVVILAVAVCVVIACVSLADSLKDDPLQVWVLCQPASFVNIRVRPSSRSETEGYVDCGDSIWFSGETKNGFLHCYCTNESGEGWIYSGYIVTDEPEMVFDTKHIVSNGRVACRKSIVGDRRCWANDGDSVYVYWMSDEWSVTNKGFIKTEFIGD